MTTAPGATGFAQAVRRDPLVIIAILGTAVGVLTLGVLHLVGPTSVISPVRRTISEYQLTDSGWAFNFGVVVIAVGSLALMAALIRLRTAGPGGIVLLFGWVVGLLTLVAFPKHNWALGPSSTGTVHRIASLVAFLCLPLAVIMITARRRRMGLPTVATRWARWLAVFSLLWFIPIVAAISLRSVTGLSWWQAIPLGLVERGMALSEVLAVGALTIALRRSPRPDPATSHSHMDAVRTQ